MVRDIEWKSLGRDCSKELVDDNDFPFDPVGTRFQVIRSSLPRPLYPENLSNVKHKERERERRKPRQCFFFKEMRAHFGPESVVSSTLTSDSRVEQLFVVSFVCPHFGLYPVEWGIFVSRSSIIITVN